MRPGMPQRKCHMDMETRQTTGWSLREWPKRMGSTTLPMTAWRTTRAARARKAVKVDESGSKKRTGRGSATATTAPRFGTKLAKHENTPNASQRSTSSRARTAAVRTPTSSDKANFPLMYAWICRSTRRPNDDDGDCGTSDFDEKKLPSCLCLCLCSRRLRCPRRPPWVSNNVELDGLRRGRYETRPSSSANANAGGGLS
mmetsp:Transcript_10128/g.33139  ORF Transcript_10128/g.33139 Transcript_10128/m.33139 type:complete len:200 (+) Transcript_10128:278-877(+)